MTIRLKGEPTEKWEPTIEDANRLGEALKNYTVTVINGKKQYPFEQHCAKEGIIRFQENGQIMIKSAFNWKRLNQIYALLQWKQEKDLEQVLIDYPEERVAYEKRLETFFRDIRSLFASKKA